MKTFYIVIAIFIGAVLPAQLEAQENVNLFEYGDSYINAKNGGEYFKPLANGLSNAFHSGLFPASDFKDKFHFYIGVNASISFISDKSWYFDGTTEAPYTPETTVEAPTVFGPNEAVVLESESGEVYVFPGGFQMDKLVLGVPQISIGGVANTNLTVRFLAVPLNEDLGDLSLFGIGIQHNFSPYFGLEKLAITLEGSYHSFKMGDWMTSDFIMVRSSAVKTFDKARLYGFIGYQNGQLDLTNSVENITTTSNTDNNFLFGLGASAELTIFNIGIECLINSSVNLNASLGFKF